jgi:hypothetical protein
MAAHPSSPVGLASRLPAPSSDPELETAACTALGLGWQVAELYDEPLPRPDGGGDTHPVDLPGLSHLTTHEKVALRVAQIERGVRALAQNFTSAHVTAPPTADLHAALDAKATPAQVRQLIYNLHVALFSALTVADYRLGKAYGLGRSLCDTTRSSQSVQELKSHLGHGRLSNLIGWCEELKTVLPGHAGQSTADSVRRWQAWADTQKWEEAPKWDAKVIRDLRRRLRLQGERWRGVLTGEKNPKDLLTIPTYVQAGEKLLADAASIGWGVIKKLWLPVLVSVLLVGLGVVVILLGSGNNVVAGLASIATGLGISWKTITPNITNLARKLADPLWGAELDEAIVVAVTDRLIWQASTAPPAEGPPPAPAQGPPDAADPPTTAVTPPPASQEGSGTGA